MIHKHVWRVVVFTALLLCSIFTQAQVRVVTGKVADATGLPLSGASVTAKNGIGTQTGTDGSFTLRLDQAVNSITITMVGYASQTVTVAASNIVNVALTANNAALNEVVVVAYGTRRKSDLTGSVTQVTTKDFQKGNIASSEQLLQGKVPGLQITTGGGSAGGGSRIRIRGGASLNASNDPLIVIDGVPVESNGLAGSANLLNTINPNDIESMSVLKDASATALYGSRASNGVLIIITKKGLKGKPKFNFNTQVSVANVADKLDVLTGDEIRSIINADATATGNNTYKNLLGTENTDWQDQIYRPAIGNDNNLSVAGSLGKLPYRLSLGYLNQQGILKTNSFNRISTSLNLSPKFLDDHLAVNIALKYALTNNSFANEGAVGAAAVFDPTKPVYASNKFGGFYEWLQVDGNPIDLSTRNPLALLELRDNTSNVNRLIGNVQLDYKLHFLPDLHVILNAGMDKSHGDGNDNTFAESATNYRTLGRYSYYQQGKTNNLLDAQLFYSKELKSIKSKFDVLVGHSYQQFYTDVNNYPSYGSTGVLIPNSTPTFETDKPEFRLESYIGRLNLTLMDKYLVTASLRRDASSKFSPENRVGYFPAVAFAWKIKEELFPESDVFGEFKLRLGLGVTGQQDGIDYYSYLSRYGRSNSSAQYQFGNTFFSFLRPSAYDANLKWESTVTSNAAIDFSMLKNRISGSLDFYIKKTRDLLSRVPVAPGANFDIEILTNVGNMRNKGVEFTLNTVPLQSKKLTWNFGFNVTYNTTEITNLLRNQDPNFKGIDVSGIQGGTGNQIGKFAIGYAPFSYFVYKQIYDKNTGSPIQGLYEDINRDGSVTNEDRYLYQKPAPDFMLGVNTDVRINRLTIGLAGHALFGNYLYNNFQSENAVLRAIKNPINFIANGSTYYNETLFTNNQYLSDYYIENASFFRLDNINFGYNVGNALRRIFDRGTLRLNASIQNALVITKYKGLDPESANSSGVDNTIYPRPRIFSIGASLDF